MAQAGLGIRPARRRRYPLLLVFYALTGGKFYYLAGLIVPLAAAGAVVLKDRKGAVPLVFVVASSRSPPCSRSCPSISTSTRSTRR